jgi:hypothetical protein
MPIAASSHSRTGKPPAAVKSSRRISATANVGSTATSHSTIRMTLTDVDHGSDTTTATASQPAIRCNVRMSSVMA